MSYQIESLQKSCPLVKVEEFVGARGTYLVGRNAKGEAVISVGGDYRRLIETFKSEYGKAVAAVWRLLRNKTRSVA